MIVVLFQVIMSAWKVGQLLTTKSVLGRVCNIVHRSSRNVCFWIRCHICGCQKAPEYYYSIYLRYSTKPQSHMYPSDICAPQV